MRSQLLGGLTPARFLAEYWQKRPLLVRQAVPGFRGVAPPRELMRLAAGEDVESKLFLRRGSRWTVREGPFTGAAFARLPERNWTLLVHGLNLHVAAADALLRRFSFIPHARLDDVLVSYAVAGGGVGAHCDSYDVFLLQGEGRRRWRIANQRDRSLDPRAPHRLLQRFQPRREFILEPGDLLYLPPGWAHEGTALDACTSYSIGFRAPTAQELGAAFLDYLRDHLQLKGRYADPDLRVQRHPGEIPAAMGRKVRRMLATVGRGRTDLQRFLGTYLSDPKPGVVFNRPRSPMGERRFETAVEAQGLRLSPRTLMLFDNTRLYINGDALPIPSGGRALLRALSDRRMLAPRRGLPRALLRLFHGWYRDGWLLTGTQHG